MPTWHGGGLFWWWTLFGVSPRQLSHPTMQAYSLSSDWWVYLRSLPNHVAQRLTATTCAHLYMLGKLSQMASSAFNPKRPRRPKYFHIFNKPSTLPCWTETQAGKLRGDLNWTWSMCAGSVGRLAGPVFAAMQRDDTPHLAEHQRQTLAIWHGQRCITLWHQHQGLTPSSDSYLHWCQLWRRWTSFGMGDLPSRLSDFGRYLPGTTIHFGFLEPGAATDLPWWIASRPGDTRPLPSVLPRWRCHMVCRQPSSCFVAG